MDVAFLGRPQRKNKRKQKIDKYFDFVRELKKTVEHQGQSNTSYSWCTENGLQDPGEETGRTGNQRENQNHTDYSIAEIS